MKTTGLIRQKRGLMALLLLACLALPVAAVQYAGNIFISSAVLNGATITGVFSSQPNQATSGPGDVPATINDNIVYNGITYAKQIIIEGSSAKTVWILFSKSGYYGMASASLGDYSAPNIILSAFTFYKTGAPTAPTIGDISTGYETAKVLSLTYDSNYNYSGVSINIVGALPADIVESGSKPTSYSMGELVEGHTLVSGQTYTFQIRGKVAGVDPELSAWSSKEFKMKSGGGTQSVDLILVPGLNSFSLGIPSNEADINWTIGAVSIKTINDLITAFGGSAKVSTFGYIQPGTSGTVDGTKFVNGDFDNETFRARNLSATQGYQVFILGTENVTVTVSNQ